MESAAADLVNLSETGLRLNSARAYEPGQPVVVSPNPAHSPVGRRRARCRVVWLSVSGRVNLPNGRSLEGAT